MKKIISYILCFSILFSLSSVAVFATGENSEKTNRENAIEYNQAKIKNIQSAIKLNQNYISELNNKASNVTKEIEQIDAYIIEIQAELDAINQEISDNDSRIEEINKQKQQRQEELLSLKETFLKQKEKLIALNTNNKYSTTNIGVKTELLKLMTKNVNDTLKSSNNLTVEENTSSSLTEIVNNSNKSKREQIQLKQSLLEQQQNEKNIILNNYYQEIANSENNIAYLEDTTETIKDVIVKLQSFGYEGNPNLKKGTGVLSYPCKTVKVTSDYGMRIHPISKVRKMHTGIDFGGQPTGTPVYASASGIVITAGWINGYGYTVIIDHGNKVSTLYAHNSKLLVSVGDEVKRGQAIAKVGSTGNSTGPHIHFEVRVNGEHTDPKEWL